jgi:hypothetical protein
MIVERIELNQTPKYLSMEIARLEDQIKKLKSCIRWYRAFRAQSSPIKSKILIYLAHRAEEAYQQAL